MITRTLQETLLNALRAMPVVALLGPRQVGKTTLAHQVAQILQDKPSIYLDLELDSDRAKLTDAESYLRRFSKQLLIIDEVQHHPNLFGILRGLVDERKRAGEKATQFLLLGSASRELLQQSSETLAGRIRYLELTPLSIGECIHEEGHAFDMEKLWFRGGFPDSYLAPDDNESWQWRTDFITTYLERDIPLIGPNVPAIKMRRFWTMLAHSHGQQINLSAIGSGLGVSDNTVRNYLDILTDFYMVRQLPPWSGNTKKRLIKSPKIYLRDTGLMHRLLNISSFDMLLGHPSVGPSWEGFITESILNQLSDKWQYSYYRTSAKAEIDLVLEAPNGQIWAIEVKRSIAPKVSKGFHLGAEDIQAHQKIVIYPGEETFSLGNDTLAMPIVELFIRLGAVGPS